MASALLDLQSQALQQGETRVRVVGG